MLSGHRPRAATETHTVNDDNLSFSSYEGIMLPPSQRPQNRPRKALPRSEIRSTDIVIIVLGTTGSGMSNFINVLTGMKMEDGANGYISCTADVIAYPCYHGGQRYIFVDTPGFNATYSSQKAVFEKIAKWLAATYQESRLQFNGVIYTRRITEARCRSERSSFQVCANIVGNHAADRVRLVTTMWDEFEDRSPAESMENKLKEEQWQLLINGGATCQRFLNTPGSAWDIVHSLGTERKASLLLQEELVDIRKPLKQTTAGMRLHKESPASLGGLLKRLFGI